MTKLFACVPARATRVTSALVSLALLTAMVSPVPAWAAPDSAKAGKTSIDPQKAFDEAQALYDKGKYEEALTKFRAAYEASQSPNARLLIARCLQALGRYVEAYDELSQTRAEASEKAATQPKYEKTRDSATADLAALETKIGKVVLTLSEPQGATVLLNDKPLAAEKLGVPITVVPGKITIHVDFPGKPSVDKEETVRGGQTRTILITPAAPEKPATEVPKPVPLVEAPKPAAPPPVTVVGGGLRTGGFVVAGLGVVSLGVFGATSMMSKNKFDSLVASCGGTRCTDPSYATTVDEGKELDVIANATLIAGVATVALGGLMIAIGGPKIVTKAEATIRIAPNGGSVRLSF